MSARIRIFYKFLTPVQTYFRSKRHELVIGVFGNFSERRIIDVGGTASFWKSINPTPDVTVVNLPEEVADMSPSDDAVKVVAGDGCNLAEYRDKEFDIAFSNSVIEHVGDAERRAAFASEVRRVASSYWVQTPSIWFPVEAHCGMPFWWFYPSALRNRLLKKWRKSFPAWSEMIAGTTVVSKKELRTLFPEGTIKTESFLLIPKSYICYFNGGSEQTERR